MAYWEFLDGPFATKREAERNIPKYMKTGKGYKRASFKVDRMPGRPDYYAIFFKETRTFDDAYWKRKKGKLGLFGA